MAEKEKNPPKPMVVPPEAKQKQDLGFLKGDWRSRTGLATPTGEKDLRPSYTLDDKGAFKTRADVGEGNTMDVSGTLTDKDSRILLDGYCKFEGKLSRK